MSRTTHHPRALRTLTLLAFLALAATCARTEPPVAALYAVEVEDVFVDAETASPVVLLRERAGARRALPIWIVVASLSCFPRSGTIPYCGIHPDLRQSTDTVADVLPSGDLGGSHHVFSHRSRDRPRDCGTRAC